MKQKVFLGGALASLIFLLAGCTNPEGRFRPPDPIGYAIFELLDRGPHAPAGQPDAIPDSHFVGADSSLSARGYPPSASSVWVDGTWGTTGGRRVWIPAHWQ
ncbi:MAG: hypothetical protein WCS65_08465 [Verrucomicrobiae bacterium]